MARTKRWSTRLAVMFGASVATFVVCCLAVELGVFLWNPSGYASRPTIRNRLKLDSVFSEKLHRECIGWGFEEDHRLPFRMKPGVYPIGPDKTITINSLGYRGREFSREKPAGTTRILFVGDSFVYGYGVDDEQTLPRLVEKQLQQRYENVEVINGGFHGSSMMQYDLYLRNEGYQLKPDIIVLVAYTGNDLFDINYNIIEAVGPDGVPTRIRDGLVSFRGCRFRGILPAWAYGIPLLDRSVLWQKILEETTQFALWRRQKNINRLHKQEFFDRSLLAIVNDVRWLGDIELVNWVIVGSEAIGSEAKDTKDYAYVRSTFERNNLPYVDLGQTLLEHAVDEICIPDDCHLNERGNAIAAAAGVDSVMTKVELVQQRRQSQRLCQRD